ncbi:hypothetical protein INT45_009763, partial [Circinella minor]
ATTLVHQRTTKATGSMALLRQLGIHIYGVGLWPALRSYRTFICLVLEYGLAIAALSPNQLEKLDNAQKSCIKMALNRKTSKHSATIVPIVLADLPSLKLRTRTLQLKFAARLQTLPVSSMAKSIELSFLWDQKHPNKQWKRITTSNPVHQRFNKLRNSPNQPRDTVATSIKEKRDEEYISRRNKFKTINCLRTKPAHRTHFTHCLLLEPLMQDLLDKFGTVPLLPHNIQPLDHILNCLPRSEVGLATSNWSKIWPALIQVLWKIDFLSHPDDIFDDDEPAPEEAIDSIPTTTIDTIE